MSIPFLLIILGLIALVLINGPVGIVLVLVGLFWLLWENRARV